MNIAQARQLGPSHKKLYVLGGGPREKKDFPQEKIYSVSEKYFRDRSQIDLALFKQNIFLTKKSA